jgi:hypothetical protein
MNKIDMLGLLVSGVMSLTGIVKRKFTRAQFIEVVSDKYKGSSEDADAIFNVLEALHDMFSLIEGHLDGIHRVDKAGYPKRERKIRKLIRGLSPEAVELGCKCLGVKWGINVDSKACYGLMTDFKKLCLEV